MKLSIYPTLIAVAALAGCVVDQYAEVVRAEAAWERCIAIRGEEAPECEALAERKRQAQGRYENDSQRALGCDPAQESCPTPR